MSALPGLQPESPDHLLGVRPLERSEAIARVLRFECTPWEAHAYYRDSQSLYQRQRLALLLQGLYRRREARSIAKARLHAQRQARYSLSSIRPRMLAAINHWRSRWLWRCFGAWRSELYHSWRVLDKAFSAVRRLSNLDLSRALNTWAQTVRERRQAFQLLKQAVRSWLQRCFARGFRTWASHSKAQQRAFRGLRRAVMAILLRELRLALTTWQSTMHSRKRVTSSPPQARAYSVRCCPMAPQFSASTDTIHSHASHSSLAIPTRLPLALVQAMQLLRSTLSTWANRRLANYWRHWRSVGRTMARAPTRARDPNEAAQIQPRTVHRTKDHPMLQVLLCCHFRAKLAAC